MVEVLVWGFDIEKVVGNYFYFVLFMIVFDILTGILLAGKERKINSSINLDGLIRKMGLLISLAFVSLIDVYFQVNGLIVKLSVGLIISYEGLSIIENLSKIGVNLNFIKKYFDPEKVGEDNE